MFTYIALLMFGPAAGSSRAQICWQCGRACVLRWGPLTQVHPSLDLRYLQPGCKSIMLHMHRPGSDNDLIHAGNFLEQDLKPFEDTMQLNYFGTLRVLKAFLPGMVKKGHGQVVLVSSAAAVCGVAGYSSYAPSKAAVRSLADTLRNEVLLLLPYVLECIAAFSLCVSTSTATPCSTCCLA